MTSPDAARDLLFGLLALQNDFVGRDALVAAFGAWVADRTRPLGRILIERGDLSEARFALMEALVQEHLKLHGGDPERSLAALSSIGSARRDLEQVADEGLRASLANVSTAWPPEEADPYATRLPSAGGPSAGGPSSSGTRFRILRPHAKGGLGQVSVALDEELDRRVALKEIQDRHADHPASRARFVQEAEITGKLEHPGIIPVYGLGHYADGRPFYAMRFIRGDSLQQAIERFHRAEAAGRDPGGRTLELRKLLGRFIDVCNAIAYAHSRGVLHRDLKPGNVMLGPYGETLVVDWGLAKPLGASAERERQGPAAEEDGPVLLSAASGSHPQTVAGAAVGTPSYMSPEQAAGRLDVLGPASDVYALGATLYSLLTGRPPVEANDVGEVLRRVMRGEVPAPRAVAPAVPRALEAICRKAMALEPGDRYDSAAALARDVERWLADEPVSSYPETWFQKLSRRARRHRAWVRAGVVALLLVTLVSVGAALLVDRARRQKDAEFQRAEGLRILAEARRTDADRQRHEAERRARIASSRQLASQAGAELERRLDRSLLLGMEALRASDTFEARAALFRALTSRPGLARFLHAPERPVRQLAFGPDGRALLGGTGSPATAGSVLLWDLAAPGELGRRIVVHPGVGIASLAAHPTEKTLAVGFDRRGGLILCDYDFGGSQARDERRLEVPGRRLVSVNSLAFGADGKVLAAAASLDDTSQVVALWDIAARDWADPTFFAVPEGYVSCLVFTPDGRSLAVGVIGMNGGVLMWDVPGRRRADGGLLPVTEGAVWSLALSPDGQTLAAGFQNVRGGSGAILWDLPGRRRLAPLPLDVPEGPVRRVRFSRDGRLLAACFSILAEQSRGGVVLWEAATRRRVVAGALAITEGGVGDVAFSPDGRSLAAGFEDGVATWDLPDLAAWTPPVADGVKDVIVAGGRTLAIGAAEGGRGISLWDLTARQRLKEVPVDDRAGILQEALLAPDGQAAVARIRRPDGSPGLVLWRFGREGPPAELPLPAGVRSVLGLTFRRDGRVLMAALEGSPGPARAPGLVQWDLAAGGGPAVETIDLPGDAVTSFATGPDGRLLAYHSRPGPSLPGRVLLRDVTGGSSLGELPYGGPGGVVWCQAFSPDGSILALGGPGGLETWDVADQRRRKPHRLDVPEGIVARLEFSPDGRILAALIHRESYGALFGSGVLIWDVETGRRLVARPLAVASGILLRLRFSPDGTALVGNTFAEVLRWPIVPTNSLESRARQVANRNLTWSEWQEYFPEEPYRPTIPDLPAGEGVAGALKAQGPAGP